MFQTISRLYGKAQLALIVLAALQLSGCGSPEDRALGYLEHGNKLLAERDNDRAGVEFRNAVKLNKNLVEAWRGLAQIAESKQQWPDLVAILRRVVEIEPKNINERVKLAKLLLLGGGVDEALKLANEAYEINSRDVSVLTLKAAVLFKLADHDGATREAQAALSIDPGSTEAAMVLAAERMAAGDAKGALQIFDSEPIAHSTELGVELFKLNIFEKTKDFQNMTVLLRKLADLYPKQIAFRRLLIKTYIDQKLENDAERELRAMIAANPTDIDMEFDLVRFLYSTRGLESAKQELLVRANSKGDVFPFRLALVDIDLAAGNVDDAIKSTQSLIGSAATSRENVVGAQVKLAQIFLNRKQFGDSEAVIAEILRKDRRNSEALKLRASVRMERGQLDEAVADLREAINDQPQSPDLLLQLAIAYERNGTIELAEKQFSDATRISGFNQDIGLAYVAFLRRHASTQRAEEVLVELTNRWPKSVEILSALAEVKLTRQDFIGAQEIAEVIRRLGNDKGVGDQILGAALVGRNRNEESIGVLQHAYEASPSVVQPMYALVRAYIRLQKTDRAIGFLKSVLQANPASAEAYTLLGAIELNNNSPGLALNYFKTAIEKQPKNAIGYRALAEFYLGQKNIKEALKAVGAGLQEQPDNGILRLIQAGIMETSGDYEGAIGIYERMLADQPGSLIVANNLASILADHREDKRSLEEARSLALRLRKSPVPQFKDTLGWVSYREGDYKVALTVLEEASAELPNLALVRYHLGMSYIASGQLEKAAEQLKSALVQGPDEELKQKIQSALKKTGL
jgi:cellulose synthase operon protein C